jgi:DNA modification methylase
MKNIDGKTISIKCESNEYKNIAELTELQGNLKHREDIDYDKIKLSIIKYGFSFPFFYTQLDGKNYILDGHGRFNTLCKMQKDGYIIPDLPCVKVECKDLKEAKEKLLRLNSTYGKMTKESVLTFAEDIDLNFDEIALPDTVIDFTDQSGEIAETEGDDEAPEVDEKSEPVSKRGEMYELGNSILMCGDSTNAEDVARLMGGAMADITFTSPPYNAGCTPTEVKMNKTSKYEGENTDDKSETEYAKFLNDYLSLSLEHSQYSFMNIQSLSNNKIAIIDTLYENKEKFADVLIWDKLNGQPAMANNVLNSVFEFIYVFSKKGNRAIGTKKYRGTIDNILHISKQNKNEFAKEHNATFPVEFAEFFVKNFSEKMVYEPFGGSGTTIIACEKNNRACRCMELSERYCDVIRRRYTQWAKENGKPITSGCLD